MGSEWEEGSQGHITNKQTQIWDHVSLSQEPKSFQLHLCLPALFQNTQEDPEWVANILLQGQ